ncbi:glutamate racemase [Serpentinicella alkaliphila]|uniref:Glutamate racemase n=1 Tax=Serpentinicella alkaliphila TaxID=1734049 RepID=A0A4R2UAB8_9FIRM|nr:glutamate racemase [Serpentinicella alkaliphila]TCQ04633.1 glutamate racemase [Serpentinicella alkaliphila]
MENTLNESPIGVFDSGLGGISVLAQLVACMPEEKYIYYGDSANAPYGVRSTDEVKDLTFKVVDNLIKYNIKALVVACNTATSAAINELRNLYDIPIIGMEPALKPAVEKYQSKDIIVMATPVTLREKKFNNLIQQFNRPENIIKLPCPGLVELIEASGGQSEEIKNYLKNQFAPFNLANVGAIVLGCTHYIFIKDSIRELVGDSIELIDGNRGTTNHLYKLLEEQHSKNKAKVNTEIKIVNSSKDLRMLDLSKELLEKQLNLLGWSGSIKYV